MKLQEILHWSKAMYLAFAVIFLTSGLFINLIQFLLYITLNRFNKHMFGKINYYLNYSMFSQIVFLVQYWANVKVKLHVNKSDYDKYFGKENVLVLFNHTYEIDWPIGWILSENCGILGNCKTFAKKSIQYIPTVGFAWKMGGSIFLERVWDKDQSIIKEKLKDVISSRDPFWMLLLAEGTRFTKEKHEASKAFARKHGLPELRHHLLPRTKGFVTTLLYMRNNAPAIYNIHLAIKPSEAKPSFRNIFLRKPITAAMYAERIPMSEVPDTEEEQKKWLYGIYKKKDDAFHSYLETGSWFELSGIKECDGFYLPRRVYPAFNAIFWCIAVLIPLGYIKINIILSGSLMSFIVICIILGFLVVFFGRLMGETEISNSSTYGINASGTSAAKH